MVDRVLLAGPSLASLSLYNILSCLFFKYKHIISLFSTCFAVQLLSNSMCNAPDFSMSNSNSDDCLSKQQ